MISVKNISALLKIDTSALYEGQAVFVEGYYAPGDGGAKTVHFFKGEFSSDGGLCHAVPGGAFVVLGNHADFAMFGIFDGTKDADDALEAMIKNPAITEITAGNPLNFAKRHRIKRGRLHFDFQGNSVTTNNCELSGRDDPFNAIFHFIGEVREEVIKITLDSPLQELNDIFPAGDSSKFELYGWYIVKCDKLEGGSEYQIDKLIQVTEIIDEKRIRLGYKMGWPLLPGRELTYTKCEPICDIIFENMKFFATPGDWFVGTHPFCFEYAVDTHIKHIYSQDNFWPLCLRKHNNRFTVDCCELVNPCEVIVGGTGYLAQNINCLYGIVRDCRVSNARHLNDFTGSAFCQVLNCHGDGDWCGSYVTHGQYEHDLSYVGCSGLLSFANSGPIWGGCATRITVERHSCSRLLAYTKISDLTLIDVQVYRREEKMDDPRSEAFVTDSGSIFLNCDGAQLRGCTAEGGIKFTNRSRRSKRRTILDGCSITQVMEGGFKVFPNEEDAGRVDFINCDFYGFSEKDLNGISEPHFINTVFHLDK